MFKSVGEVSLIQILKLNINSPTDLLCDLGYVRRRIEAKLINWPFSPLRLAS